MAHDTHCFGALGVLEPWNDRIVVEIPRIAALTRPSFQGRHFPSIFPTASSVPPSTVSARHAIDLYSRCPHRRDAAIQQHPDRGLEARGEPAPVVT